MTSATATPGDDPDLDYRLVSPELRQIRGPYPFAPGIGAYEKHVEGHRKRPAITSQAARRGRDVGLPARAAHSR